jgi:AcrR family transcriptional regulator
VTDTSTKWNLDSQWLVPPQQARSRKTLEAILDAAEALFVAQGYENTSISDISARSGISIGSIYSRFPDKDSILQVIHDSFSRALVATPVESILPDEGRAASASEIVMAIVESFFFVYRTHAGILCLLERQRLVNPAIEDRMQRWNRLAIAKFQALVRRRATDIPHPDPDHAVVVVHYMLHQTLAMTALFEQAKASPPFRIGSDDFKRDMMQVALRYFGLPDDTSGWRPQPREPLPGW